jgi:hypothetical protein
MLTLPDIPLYYYERLSATNRQQLNAIAQQSNVLTSPLAASSVLSAAAA